MFDPSSTIVAIATPPGRGGIGVVRISGTLARVIAAKMLITAADPSGPRIPNPESRIPVSSPGSSSSPAETLSSQPPVPGSTRIPNPESRIPVLPPRHATHCLVVGPDGRGLDEVVATFFESPRSYTGEDVVEISAHGSPALLGEILHAAMRAGARLAEPGEFTLRAFLNGRIDLAQAEAVNDLVESVTPLQARVAFDQLQGTLTEAIGQLDRDLFEVVVRLEASLDFPDEGYHFADRDEVAAALAGVRQGVSALLATARQGRVVREGRQIAILGKPNVGKSTMFNRLVGADRAIVTDIPGTTRDLVTETVNFEGIRLGVVDTAGIRDGGADVIETEGIARARRAAAVADVVILIFDQSRPLEVWDYELLDETSGRTRVLVVNKADLAAEWDLSSLLARSASTPQRRGVTEERPVREAAVSRIPNPEPRIPDANPAPGPGSRVPDRVLPVSLSLKSGAGWEDFRSSLLAALHADGTFGDGPMVTNLRHQALLEEARKALEKADVATSEEFLLADISQARRAFEEITGKRTAEDVLRAIFSRFCIGK